MRKDLVLNYGGVVVHEDIFNGNSGDLSEEYAAESISDRGVDADKRK